MVLYQYCSMSLLASKMIYKSSYQAIPNADGLSSTSPIIPFYKQRQPSCFTFM